MSVLFVSKFAEIMSLEVSFRNPHKCVKQRDPPAKSAYRCFELIRQMASVDER